MDKPGGGRQGHSLSRRKFLTVAGSAGVAVAATQFPFAKAKTAPARFTGYPFTLGVASGDPTSDSVVLWTRLAPSPLDGNGGMPDKAIAVQWEVAKDENFANVVARGEEQATYGDAHSVHAEPQGLEAGYEYFYRFKANGEISPTGRTKTAPSGPTSALAFAFASCQQYEHGYYTAYKHMSQEDLDLVIHLGDYIYEYDSNSYTATGGNVRANSNHEIVNLQDYRERHAQYKTDPDLQAAHGNFAWLVTFDDHEIDNNWAGDIPEEGMPLDIFARRRRAAFKAYWEHMPLRKATRPSGNAIQIFRRAQYGNLASFHVMDTRQFRSDQACGDGTRAGCDDRSNPARTLTGAAQEQWLYDGMQSSPAKWQILAQQVFMAQRDATVGAGESYSMDGWDGYKVSRDKLLDFIDTRRSPTRSSSPATCTRTGPPTCCATSRTRRRRSSAPSSWAPRSRPRATAATPPTRGRCPRTRGSSTTASGVATSRSRSTSRPAARTTRSCPTSSARARRSRPTGRSSSKPATPA